MNDRERHTAEVLGASGIVPNANPKPVSPQDGARADEEPSGRLRRRLHIGPLAKVTFNGIVAVAALAGTWIAIQTYVEEHQEPVLFLNCEVAVHSGQPMDRGPVPLDLYVEGVSQQQYMPYMGRKSLNLRAPTAHPGYEIFQSVDVGYTYARCSATNQSSRNLSSISVPLVGAFSRENNRDVFDDWPERYIPIASLAAGSKATFAIADGSLVSFLRIRFGREAQAIYEPSDQQRGVRLLLDEHIQDIQTHVFEPLRLQEKGVLTPEFWRQVGPYLKVLPPPHARL